MLLRVRARFILAVLLWAVSIADAEPGDESKLKHADAELRTPGGGLVVNPYEIHADATTQFDGEIKSLGAVPPGGEMVRAT